MAHKAQVQEGLSATTTDQPDVLRSTFPYELTIVIPTLNEAGNVEVLFTKLNRSLTGIRWEVIFVDDDSTDGTAEVIRRIANLRPNVRCLQRIGRRGLSSACVEGMMASTAPFLAVMDGDLQHDESLLAAMLAKLKREQLDIVIASRFAYGSHLGSFAAGRERLSRVGNVLSRMVSKASITDPLSGFFMLRRELLNEVVRSLSAKGFKILLDIFASSRRPLRYGEVPLHFRERHSGESKLDILVALEFVSLLADKTLGRFVPVRFVLFVLVGAFGVLVHLVALGLMFWLAGTGFASSQATATLIAILVNFCANNEFTYRDQRLRGVRFLHGLLTFLAACLIGAAINLEIAKSIFTAGAPWPLAGALGAVVGSVWNYAASATFTWPVQKERGPALAAQAARNAYGSETSERECTAEWV